MNFARELQFMSDDVTNGSHTNENIEPHVPPVSPETLIPQPSGPEALNLVGSGPTPVTMDETTVPTPSPVVNSVPVAPAPVPSPQAWVYQDSVAQPSTAHGGVKVAIIAGIIAGLISGALGYTIADKTLGGGSAQSTLTSVKGDTSPRAANSIAGIAKLVLPVVVSIDVSDGTGSGTGSGFIVRSSATSSYILTNNHVVASAANGGQINVVFQDQTETEATIVGRDPSYDLAVIKINKGNLPIAILGNSDDVVVGDTAIAIGSPLGLTGTVTSGIVSALDRPVTAGGASESSFINAIQTDAAINPGNSGGPLVNARGQVIGINSAIATLGNNSFGATETGSIGLGFAIPINEARRVANQLITTGKSSHPIIGVTLDLNYSGQGARVTGITAGGPASKTDLKVGDVITKIDGQRVSDATELIVRIRARNSGDTVVLSRDGESDVTVVLGSRASN